MTHYRPLRADRRRWLVAALALAVPAAALYMWTAQWPDTPDGLFHLHRARALAEALRMGVLYPRWFPDFAFGYGYPVLNFYAPAFYYPPALLHLTGLDLITAARVTLAGWYALSGLAMYALLRRWLSPLPATLGATLYLAYPYRLYDLFVRGALPEFAAFLWLPLIALTTINWTRAIPKNASDVSVTSRLFSAVAAALSWAGLILTHNLTALMTALAGLGMAMAWTAGALLRWLRGDRSEPPFASVWELTLPLVLGAALSAAYALPALVETGWVGLSTGTEVHVNATHFATLQSLFDPSFIYRYPEAAQPTVPTPPYAAMLLIVAALALFLPQAQGRRTGLGISAAGALGALWLSTRSSAFVWNALAPVLGKLQFPWRWQTLVALALSCTLGWLLEVGGQWLAAHSRFAHARPLSWSIALILAAYFVLHAFGELHPTPASLSAADLVPDQMWDFDMRHGQVGTTWTGEFLPRWVTEQRWAIGRDPSEAPAEAAGPPPTSSAIQSVRVFTQRYLGERLTYYTSTPGQLVYHVFYYPAWRVEVDGRAVPTRAVSNLGLLAVDLPAGQHELTRQWDATPAVWAGRAISAVAWLVVLGFLIFARDHRRPLFISLWLLAAVLAMIAGSDWLMREQSVPAIGADYGTVRLEAAVASSARAGHAAIVTLYWLVMASPEPLTAYVHVVASDGRMVTGHDAPLGGPYTPPSRWLIGELLPDRHVIPLPADLPPGVYSLKAGLYPSGAPDAPLIPEGHSSADPRVDIGVLEVQP